MNNILVPILIQYFPHFLACMCMCHVCVYFACLFLVHHCLICAGRALGVEADIQIKVKVEAAWKK